MLIFCQIFEVYAREINTIPPLKLATVTSMNIKTWQYITYVCLSIHFAKVTTVVQKVLQMLGFHRYKRLILAKFVMLE